MKKHAYIFLIFVVVWSVLIYFVFYLAGSTEKGMPEIPMRITLLKDIDVFCFRENGDNIQVDQLRAGKKLAFSEEGSDVIIETNDRYVDLVKSQVFEVYDTEKKKLSDQEKVLFFTRLSAGEIDLEVDSSSAEKVQDSLFFNEYLDFSGKYEGRIYITWECPRVNRSYTDIDQLANVKMQNEQKDYFVWRYLLAATAIGVLLGIILLILVRKKEKILMTGYIIVVSLLLPALIFVFWNS